MLKHLDRTNIRPVPRSVPPALCGDPCHIIIGFCVPLPFAMPRIQKEEGSKEENSEKSTADGTAYDGTAMALGSHIG